MVRVGLGFGRIVGVIVFYKRRRGEEGKERKKKENGKKVTGRGSEETR